MQAKPLPSGPSAFGDEESPDEEPETSEEAEESPEEGKKMDVAKSLAPARPPPPPFKFSTFILVFLFFLGFWMIISPDARTQVAIGIGSLLYPVFGFNGHFPLLTMFLIGVLQMTMSAIAYNFTTDWVESAKVQQHAKAIRPLQMAAMRSGKKQHQEALKPHMNDLNTRQTKMMIGQLKGMAVTWFLLIAIYTWVGIFLNNINPSTHQVPISMFGIPVNILGSIGGFLPLWFLVFSLYTLPMNLLIRRFLKHQTLARHADRFGPSPGAPATPSSSS